MLGFMAQGAGFGFAAGSSPGPWQSFLISSALSRGWRRTIVAVFSPLIVDAPIILVMTFLLKQLPEDVERFLKIAGGLFVLWLAWINWQALRRGEVIGSSADEAIGESRQILLQAITMNVLSPGPYIFWGSVTGPILIDALNASVVQAIAFLIAFYGCFLGLTVGIILAFDRLRRLDEQFTKGILMAAIGILAVLGIRLVVQGIHA
jgi:threonine/homoserine/homoserine lactone efflux protein